MGVVKIGSGRGVRLTGPDGLLQFEVEPQVAFNYHADMKRALVYPREYPQFENKFRRDCYYDGSECFIRWNRMSIGPKGAETPLTLDGWKFRRGAE